MFPRPRGREGVAQACERSLGVIGDLEPLASADFLQQLVIATEAQAAVGRFNIVLEPHDPVAHATQPDSGPAARQLHIFDGICCLAARGVETVLPPSFSSYEFIEELKVNSPLPIADMLKALRGHIRRRFPAIRCIGIVTSRHLRTRGVFEPYFPTADSSELVFPRTEEPRGDEQYSLDLLREACTDLIDRGAELVIPGLSELIPLARKLPALGVPVIDPYQVYAQYAVVERQEPPRRALKLGVVGGVGPAATVDFLQKVVRNTPAHRDQDHIKVLVEQNPQIPDRTGHLLGQGPDPTLALYATCRKLQAGQADIIAIPCNTAHAFVASIEQHLDIPIINMLAETVRHVRESFPALRQVGLLATTGTLASGIYHRALGSQGLREVVPPPALQARMMNAIYGPEGIKAGFTSGQCVEDVHAVIDELVSRGVEVVILGCTELPLVFHSHELTARGGQRVTLVDPTEILAIRCVFHALVGSEAAALPHAPIRSKPGSA